MVCVPMRRPGMTRTRNHSSGNCSDCGRFCRPGDVGVYYGDPRDLEPPDETVWCERCAMTRIEQAKNRPESIVVGCWWVKPDFVSVARAIVRHRRRRNLK